MKKLFVLATLLVLAVIGTGCDNDGKKSDADLRVALVITGAINDNGWCQIGYEGLKAIEKQYGAEVAYAENIQPAQYNQVINDYAKDGYDVILAHGMEFKDAVYQVADKYPDTQFFISSSDRNAQASNGKNISGILADGVQQGFIMGAAAGYIAKEQGSSTVAAVGGLAIPAITTTLQGYELGVAYANGSVKVLSAYTGDFTDINKLKEQSISFINQGASVVMSTANAATRGGLEATKAAGGVSIGANVTSLMGDFKDNLALSVNNSMSQAMTTVVGYLVKGDFKADNYVSGVKEGVITMDISTTQPMALKVKDKIQAVYEDVKSGKIDVTKLYKEKF